jgi:type IV pilus assembly protein PilE
MINKYTGFTLIELLIVVAIIGILMAIGYPAYSKYVMKTNRTDVQSQMVQIARNLANYKIANGTYSNVTLVNANIYGQNPSTFPKAGDGDAMYTLELELPNSSSWILTAKPVAKSKMDGDGIIKLDSSGQKCWQEKSSTCTLSETSKWN